MPVIPNKPVNTAPLVDIPIGGTAAGAARQYSTNLGAPMQPGTNAVGAFNRGGEFWKPITDGLQQVARAGSEIIQRSLQEQAETEALEAYSAWAREMNEFVDNDIMSRKGLNAFHVVDEVAEFAAKGEERHAKGLTTDAARKMFSGRALDFRRGIQSKVSTYQGGERRQARFNATESAAATEKDLAMNNFGNDRLFAEGKARGLQHAAELAAMNGWDEKTTALYLQKAAGEYDAGRVERFAAAGDYERAFNEWKGSNMSADAKFKTGQALEGKYLDAMLLEAHQNPFHMREQLQKRRYGGAGVNAKLGERLPAATKDLATRAAEKAGVDTAFSLNVCMAESGGNADALSPVGARGLYQLRPATQRELEERHGIDGSTPEGNAQLGNLYLKELLDRYDGDKKLALMAYNAGMANADEYAKTGRFKITKRNPTGAVFKETENYVAKILGDGTHADRRLDPQTVDDLVGPAGLYRVEKAADTELKQQAAVLLHGKDDALSFAIQRGDSAAAEKMRDDLFALGQNDAALELDAMLVLYQQAQPLLQPSTNEPLLQQSAQAKGVFEGMRTPENSAKVDKVYGMVRQGIEQKITQFKHDPAGYVADNPALKDASLSTEERTRVSLELQRQVGTGIDATPQVLTAAQAGEARQRYEGTGDYGQKAAIATALYKEYGRYATQAATEAKLPAGLIAVAQVSHFPGFTQGDAVKMAIAADADDKMFSHISTEDKNKMRDEVLSDPFTKTLIAQANTMYTSEQQRQFAYSLTDTLVKYRLMGNSMAEFRSRFLVVNDGDMQIIAPRGTPFNEDDLQHKKGQLLFELEHIDPSALFPNAPSKGVAKMQADIFKASYRDMYDNGVWMYDPAEDGFVLWDRSGRAAPTLEGGPVILKAGDINTSPPHPASLGLHGGYR